MSRAVGIFVFFVFAGRALAQPAERASGVADAPAEPATEPLSAPETASDSVEPEAPASDSAVTEATVTGAADAAAATTSPDSSVAASWLVGSPGESPADPAVVHRTGVPWALEVGMQVFAQYELRFPRGAEWFHEIDVPRTWLWTSFRVENAVGRILVEGTRAGGDGSLIGVGGDSLVVRFREAWLGYRLFDLFEIRAGLVPQLTTPDLTALWQMRAVRAIGLRDFELMQPADLGASLRFEIPAGFGHVSVAYLSGEGYRGRELNRGKTLEVEAQIHPLAFVPEATPLTLTLAYQNGSTGTGAVRADRVVGGLAWADPRWGLGVELAYVLGFEGSSEREALLVEAWGRVEPIEHLLVGARYAHFTRTLGTPDTDEIDWLTTSVGAWIVEAVRVHAAFDVQLASERARAELPGFEGYALRIVFEGDLGARFEGSF